MMLRVCVATGLLLAQGAMGTVTPPPWASHGIASQGLAEVALSGAAPSNDAAAAGPLWLDVQLDHFSESDSRNFPLKYFVDASSHKTQDLGFLQIGGEGPLNGIQNTSFFSVLARKHGALQVIYSIQTMLRARPSGRPPIEFAWDQ